MAGEPPFGDRIQPGSRRRARCHPSLRTGAELPVARVLCGGDRALQGARRGGRNYHGSPARRRAPLASGCGRGQLPGPGPGRVSRSLGFALRGPDGHHGRPAPRVRRGRPAVGELLGLGAALPSGRSFATRRPRPPEQPLEPARDGDGYHRPRARRHGLPGAGLGRGLPGLGTLLLRAHARGADRFAGGPGAQEPPFRRRACPRAGRLPPRTTPGRPGRVALGLRPDSLLAVLIKQGQQEEDHAEEAQYPLRDDGDHVSDQHSARRPGRLTPVPASRLRLRWHSFPGRATLAAPEVLAGEDSPYRAEYESEERSDTQEKRPGQRTDDPADGSADGAPVTRAEPACPVGSGGEVCDERYSREDAKQRDDEPADVLEVRQDRVDERGEEDQGYTRQARHDATGEPDQHDDKRDPDYRFAGRLHTSGDDRQCSLLLSTKRRVQAAGLVAGQVEGDVQEARPFELGGDLSPEREGPFHLVRADLQAGYLPVMP